MNAHAQLRAPGIRPQRRAGLLLLLSAFAVGAPAKVAIAQARPQAAGEHSEQRFAALLRTALAHFRQSDFAAAAAEFEAALQIAPAGLDVSALEFNAAASEYALGHYAQAERRFASLAGRAPSLAALCTLDAGMAALRDGRLGDAKRYLQAAPPGNAEATTRRAELSELVASEERAQAEREFQSALSAGLAAYQAGHNHVAQSELERCLRLDAGAAKETRALIRLTLGYLAQERAALSVARARFDEAIAQGAQLAEAHVARAELALVQSDDDAAAADALRALSMNPVATVAERARAILRALDVLPARGLHATVALGAGWDSNAWQSGPAAASDLGSTAEKVRSFYGAASAQVEAVMRPGRKLALAPYYSVDLLMPTEAIVQELALQVHELGAQLQLSPTPKVRWRLNASGSLVLSGLRPIEPFSFEGAFGTWLALDHLAAATLRAGLVARPVLGLAERGYLSGVRLDGTVEERLALGLVHVSFEAGYRYNAAGTRTIPIDPSVYFSSCGTTRCIDAAYIVPLSYQGPLAAISADFDLTAWLLLGARASFEYRRYVSPNTVRNVPDSATLRHDLRYRARGRAEWSLDSARRYALIASYDLLVSDSNVALDDSYSRHQFDYTNRNFVQHIIELSSQARF